MRHKQFMNRLLSVILAAALILPLFPVTAFAEGAAAGTAFGTAGYDYINVNLSAGEFSSVDDNVTSVSNWSLTSTGEHTISGITKQDSTSVEIILSESITEGDVFTLEADAAVFQDGTGPFDAPLEVTIDVPTPEEEIKTLADEGITPPQWADGYPVARSIGDKNFSLAVKGSENGSAYFVRLPFEAAPPTAEQVAAGKDAEGNVLSYPAALGLSITANIETAINIRDLMPDTSYDVYVVLEDSEGNLQDSPELVPVTTTVPDDGNSGITNKYQDVNGSKRVRLTVTVKNSEGIASRGYTAADFSVTIDGMDTTLEGPEFSGFDSSSDNGIYYVVFTGDADNTEYTFTDLTVSGVVIDAGPTTVTTPPAASSGTAPTITEAVMDAENDKITITFSEGVYGNAANTIGINKDDFDLNFVQNGGGVSGASIRWVNKTSEGVQPTGGETQFDILLDLVDGPPSGTETITISPKADSIYSSAGIAIPTTESTAELKLYNLPAQSFADGYPKTGAPQPIGSHTIKALAKANQAGVLFYVLLPDGATPPTAQQIKDHADIDGNPVISWGQQLIGTETEVPITLSNLLAHATNYDLYMVTTAGNNNFSAVGMLNVNTPPETDTQVNIGAIPDVTVPVTGATPVTAITETEQYTGTVSWSPAHSSFDAATTYTATINLSPKVGYTLVGVTANFFTVAGAATVTNSVDSGVVTAVFPETALPTGDAVWNYRSPLPSNNIYENVKYIGGKYMAVGYNGTLVTSTDGETWQKIDVGTDTDRLNGIAYGGGKYVIVGTANDYVARIFTSDNGLDWHETAAVPHHWLHDVVYGNNEFVAVGQSGKILISDDGEDWETITLPSLDNEYTLLSVTYGEGLYVASGMGATTAEPKGGIMTSSDGRTWEVKHNNSYYTLWDVTYGGGTFVCVGGTNTGSYFTGTSSDGMAWTQSVTGYGRLFSVEYDGSKFIAAGNTGGGSGNAFVTTSTDGIGWTEKTNSGITGFRAIASSGSRLVAMGGAGNIYTSDDGGTGWIYRTLGTTKTLRDAAWNGSNLFVSVGREGAIQTSADGVTWTIQTSGTTYDLNKVDYLNGQFIAVGKSGTILTSTDGTSWTSQTSGTTADLQGIAFGEGVYVTGGNGAARISSDGINWTAPAGLITLRTVAYGNGGFVALTQYGGAFNSDDGVNWSNCTSLGQFAEYPTDMIYAHGKFVAVGGYGKVYLSSDNGVNWTTVQSDINQDYILDITYGAGNFAAVANNGKIIASADGGTTWFMQPSNLTPNPYFSLDDDAQLYGIVKGDDSFVAVGGHGVILQSDSFSVSIDSDAHDVALDKAGLYFSDISGSGSNGGAGYIVADMNLIKEGDNGTSISWASSKPEYTDTDGNVNRPAYEIGDQVVYLTATISKGGASDTKTFIVIVAAYPDPDIQVVEQVIANLTFDVIKGSNTAANSIISNLNLITDGGNGTTVSWASSNTSYIAVDGTVTRPAKGTGDQSVILTATISKGSVSTTKTFSVAVKAMPVISVTGIAVKAQPADLTYTAGETLDLTGLVMTLTYSDSSTEDVALANFAARNITVNPAHGTTMAATHHNQPVIVSCGGHNAGTNNLTITVNTGSTGSNDDSDRNRSGGSNSSPAPMPQSPVVQVIDSNGSISRTITTSMNNISGTVSTQVDSASLAAAFDKSEADGEGTKTVKIVIPKVDKAKAYEAILPVNALTAGNAGRALEIVTGMAAVTLPSNMVDASVAAGGKNISLTIGSGDKSKLTAALQELIGGRPLVELGLKIDGKMVSWNNENAPVTVSIPYTPTAEELKDPEHITVWYIDGAGNVNSVSSGRYDPATGRVTFVTTHFSRYAVAYVKKTFSDISEVAWAKKQIEVLASKGILRGISENEYSPKSSITRADYLYSLIRALGVDAKVDGNFSDISTDKYYYKEIGIAKKLGITTGTGGNRFDPDALITRQDMMVLTARALDICNMLEQAGDTSVLDKFSDKGDIAPYAAGSMAALVDDGLLEGSGGRINPRANTTRAEAAVLLYRIYNK